MADWKLFDTDAGSDLTIECKDCGDTLNFTMRKDGSIEVSPCDNCMTEAKQTAHGEGVDETRKRYEER